MTKSTCTPRRKALAKRFKSGDLSECDRDAAMKMGASYRVAGDGRQARVCDDDQAHRTQDTPDMRNEAADDGGLTDYTTDLKGAKKGSDIQQAGEKFLKHIHQDIDAEKAAGKVHSFDDVDEMQDVGYDYAPGEKMTGGAPINIDVSKLEDVEVEGVDSSDYPDFVDAYISSATYNGRELSDQELDWLNNQHPEVAQQAAHGHMQSAGDFAHDVAKDRAMGLEEAGGGAENNTSYRTVNDIPQKPENRHRGDIDETAKKSDVQKTIEKGGKGKTATKKQKLAYKAPKKTKSGIVKKRD